VTITDLKKEFARAAREKFERSFAAHWRLLDTEIELEPQAILVPGREFAFDFAHHESKVAVELDGGLYVNGGHSRGASIEESYVKLRAAARLGWCVLKYGTKQMARIDSVVIEVLDVIRERTRTHG